MNTNEMRRHAKAIEDDTGPCLATKLLREGANEIEHLREALLDTVAHLVGATSAYQKYAKRASHLRPRAEVDAFFTTRVNDFCRAEERARQILELCNSN